MNKKYNDATPGREKHLIDAKSVFIDIPALIQQIRQEDAWQKSDRNSITVFKSTGMTIVLGGLHKNAELPPHSAEVILSIQVIEGLLTMYLDELIANVHAGQMITIHEHSNYRITAIEETIYLLTVTGMS